MQKTLRPLSMSISLAIALLLALPVCAQNAPTSDVPSITVIVPGSDYVKTSYDRYRVSGHTEPGNTLTVNDEAFRLYPTGAFAGLLYLKPGVNTITLIATSPENKSVVKTIQIERTPPLTTTSVDVLTIEDAMMLPDRDLELNAGDILEVRIKGTPDLEASFSLGWLARHIPMTELPFSETNGLRGIYTGIYKVKPGDRLKAMPLKFHLKKSWWRKVSKKSKALVIINPDAWPKVGEVVEEHAYLAVGLGQARLGGAQLGHIPVGTRLELTGRRGGDEDDEAVYRVRLSASKEAWIPASFIKVLPRGTHPPRSLVNAATVSGDQKYDIVTMALSERLPFCAEVVMNPSSLVVELYDATSNITWITNKPEAREIKELTWQQAETDLLRFTIALKHEPVWGYDVGYEKDSKMLYVKIRRAPQLAEPPDSPLKGLTVAVDIGHGGEWYGAVGATGLKEKDVNRATADLLMQLLEDAGANVVELRPDDEATTLSLRIDRALEADADLLISIHANSIGALADPIKVKGVMDLYKYPPNREITECVQKRLLEIGLEDRWVISSFNSSTVKVTQMTSFLVEQAFMSNPEDEALLMDQEFRKKIAQAIFNGLEDYYSAVRKRYQEHGD
jgi:N-acetylmuramoyl-L-alanine amidase